MQEKRALKAAFRYDNSARFSDDFIKELDRITQSESYADHIFDGTAEAARIVSQNRVHICTTQPQKTAMLKRIIQKMVDSGMQNIIEDSGLVRVFLYDPEENTGNELLLESDGICYWQDDANNAAIRRCIIGISVAAFRWGNDYISMLFLHELTHGLLRYAENNHDAVYHNQLDELIMMYNSLCGGNLKNDYIDLPPSERKYVTYYTCQ